MVKFSVDTSRWTIEYTSRIDKIQMSTYIITFFVDLMPLYWGSGGLKTPDEIKDGVCVDRRRNKNDECLQNSVSNRILIGLCVYKYCRHSFLIVETVFS